MYENTKFVTHNNIYIRWSYNTRPQSRIQYYTTKHNFVTGFINRSISLNENGITFVHIFDICRLEKINTRQAACCKFVFSWRGLADLTKQNKQNKYKLGRDNKKFK